MCINFLTIYFLNAHTKNHLRISQSTPYVQPKAAKLKQSLSLNDEETIILLTERSAAHRYYDSLTRLVSMKQTTLEGVDEKLKSLR